MIKRIETSYDVWVSIHKKHKDDLHVFSTYIDCDHDVNRVYTSYSFNGMNYPFIEAETTWDIAYDEFGNIKPDRINEKHECFICVIID